MSTAPGPAERLEQSRAGRIAISVVLVALLTVVVALCAQPSPVQREIVDAARPVVNALAIDQGWGVFAPDPRPVSLAFFARVQYADGLTETWRMPEGGAVIGEYWDYRWRKYLEYVTQDPWAGVTWRQMAGFIARDVDRDGRHPTRVTLVRRMQDVLPPGDGPDRGPRREQAYFVLDVDDRVLR
jgi:hypothetical protein